MRLRPLTPAVAVFTVALCAAPVQAQSLERDIERLVESLVGSSERLGARIEKRAQLLAERITQSIEWRTDSHGARRDRDDDAMQQSKIDTTFAFAANGTIDVNGGTGDVIVTGSDRSDVQIRASSERGTFRLDATSSRLSLEVRSERGSNRGGRYGDTHLELLVPQGTRVVARTSSGDVKVRTIRGGVEAGSGSGDIDIDDSDRVHVSTISGEVRLRGIGEVDASSVSGEVIAERISGDVRLSSTSGDVVATQSTARFVSLSSSSGDIGFDGNVDPAGRYQFETHSGTVELTLARATNANISIATYSGDIESDFPLVLQPGAQAFSQPRRLEFTLGNGGPRIVAESFSGDVELRRK